MQARTGGNTREGLQVISLGCNWGQEGGRIPLNKTDKAHYSLISDIIEMSSPFSFSFFVIMLEMDPKVLHLLHKASHSTTLSLCTTIIHYVSLSFGYRDGSEAQSIGSSSGLRHCMHMVHTHRQGKHPDTKSKNKS